MNLSQLLQAGLRKTGQIRYYLATGGSGTTAIVAQLQNKKSISRGVLFVVETTDNAAPEGEYQRITSYAKASGTFTIDTITAIASGDKVGVAGNLYPIHTVVELANDALTALGDIVLVDTTTIDSEDNRTEYDLPVAWKRGLLQLDIQGKTDDANDNQWIRIFDVDEYPAAPGAVGNLILPQLPSGRDLRGVYVSTHPRVSAFDDVIDEEINPEVATWALVVEMLNWQYERGKNATIAQSLTSARNELARAKADFPIRRREKKAMIFNMSRTNDSSYTGTVDLVRI